MGLRICYPFLGRFIGGSHLCILEVLKHIDTEHFEPLIVVHRKGQISDALPSKSCWTKIARGPFTGGQDNLRSI